MTLKKFKTGGKGLIKNIAIISDTVIAIAANEADDIFMFLILGHYQLYKWIPIFQKAGDVLFFMKNMILRYIDAWYISNFFLNTEDYKQYKMRIITRHEK